MREAERELYWRAGGDRWFSSWDNQSYMVLVPRGPNAASGSWPARLDVGNFLARLRGRNTPSCSGLIGMIVRQTDAEESPI